MIIEQHYDDEVLIGLLDEAEEDSHVPACNTCAGTLESYRDLSSALHDGVVWDEREVSETPSPKTANFLRSFAERTRIEDAAARPIVAKLIADPALIDQHAEWRTAGVVRGLLKAVDERNFSEPKVAADLAALAVKVADAIEAGYPLDTLRKLRANAWHERGYALYVIGAFAESLAAYDSAETLLKSCGVSAYELGELTLHRAQLYGETERISDGILLAASAADTFRQFGNVRRRRAAEATRGALLMIAARYDEALPIQEDIAADTSLDDLSRALGVYHAAICYRERLRLDEAKRLFTVAISEFERLDQVARRVKARWCLGTVFALEKRYAEALRIFNQVRVEFEELGLAQDVAFASIEAAEALLMLGRTAEVPAVCLAAMDYFKKAGLTYSQGALTALAYMKEAAEANRLTHAAVGQVRNFFEILPKQPHLLFAFPL